MFDDDDDAGKPPVPSDYSWVVQLGSRFHPVWPLLLPLLRLTSFFHCLVNLFRLSIEGLDVEVNLDDEGLWPDDDDTTSSRRGTGIHFRAGEIRVELRSHRGEDRNRIMTFHVSLKAEDKGDLLFATAGSRSFIDLVKVTGALSASMDLPWPPPMMTVEDRKQMNGFGYLSRPPILPSLVTIALGDSLSLWIDEDVAHSLLRALGPLVLSPSPPEL